MVSIGGFFIIIVATSQFGVGISPDSINYIECARSILAGKGLVDIYNKPFVTWPPLFPVILALGVKVGFNILNFARFFNGFIFGLLIYFSGKLFRQYVKSNYLALFGALIVLFSITYLYISEMLWSDSFFVLLGILFLYFLNCYSLKPKGFYLYFVSFCAALACLQRYAGVTLIFTGLTFFLFFPRKFSFSKKVQNAFIFGLISSFPLFLVLLRNFLVSKTFTGIRSQASFSLLHYMIQTINCVMIYFIHPSINFYVSLVIFGAFFGLFTIAIVYNRSDKNRSSEMSVSLFFLVFFILFNIGFIIYSSIHTNLDEIPYRYLAIVYAPIIAFALVGIDCLKKMLDDLLNKKLLSNAFIAILCLAWLQSSLYMGVENINHMVHFGAGTCSNLQWEKSQLIRLLNFNRIKGGVFSNAPDVIYILCDIKAEMLPHRSGNLKDFSQKLSKHHDNYLVWFKRIGFRPYLLTVDELKMNYKIDLIKQLDEGSIYKIYLR